MAVVVDELQHLHALLARRAGGEAGQWGHFTVIARRWEDPEPIAALCLMRAIPVQMQRDGLRALPRAGTISRLEKLTACPGGHDCQAPDAPPYSENP